MTASIAAPRTPSKAGSRRTAPGGTTGGSERSDSGMLAHSWRQCTEENTRHERRLPPKEGILGPHLEGQSLESWPSSRHQDRDLGCSWVTTGTKTGTATASSSPGASLSPLLQCAAGGPHLGKHDDPWLLSRDARCRPSRAARSPLHHARLGVVQSSPLPVNRRVPCTVFPSDPRPGLARTGVWRRCLSGATQGR